MELQDQMLHSIDLLAFCVQSYIDGEPGKGDLPLQMRPRLVVMKVGSVTGDPGVTATLALSPSSSSLTRWKLCAFCVPSMILSSQESSSLRLCTSRLP